MTPLECRAARQKMKYRIRERLERRGTSMNGVADDLGVNKDLVIGTIYGKRNNRRVLLALRDTYGVPEKYLFIPEGRGSNNEEAA
jgi:transcriptional regulator with XRE-family HTH domain